jgi:hypothetical protein
VSKEAVIGLRELRRAAARIDKDMNKQLTKVLKAEVAAPVVTLARGLVPVKTGKLRSSIKASVRGGIVSIQSSPPLNASKRTPKGYAAVYEYGNGGTRAFLRPAVDRFEGSGGLERAADDVLAWVESEWPR